MHKQLVGKGISKVKLLIPISIAELFFTLVNRKKKYARYKKGIQVHVDVSEKDR